jgi:hypothetical protein
MMNVTTNLSSISTTILSLDRWPSQEGHISLNYVLSSLHGYFKETDKSECLILNVKGSNKVFGYRKDILLKLCRGRLTLNEKFEFQFPMSNPANVAHSLEVFSKDIKRVFSYRQNTIVSVYLWNGGEQQFKIIDSEHVVGICGKAFTLRSLSFICKNGCLSPVVGGEMGGAGDGLHSSSHQDASN